MDVEALKPSHRDLENGFCRYEHIISIRKNMKLILISDIHLLLTNLNSRKDNIIKTQWDKLRYVYDAAVKYDAPIIQAGDFVESPRSWVLAEQLMEFFSKYPAVHTYFIPGQHDIYFRSSSLTTMKMMTKVFKNVHLLSNKTPTIIDEVAIFGCGYMDKLRNYNGVLNKLNILVVHKPITNVTLNYETHDAENFLKKHSEFNCILCGDIHRKFYSKINGRHILNTSSLVRKTRLDSNPSFCILNTKTNTCDFIDIPVEDNVFQNTSKNENDFLEDFISNVENTTFLVLTPKEKILTLLDRRKYKSVRKLALEIMEET